MEKIKSINDFENILDYFYYLKTALEDLNEKKNNAVSEESKKFYTEQIDLVLKNRNAIRDVVLSKKNMIINDKLNNIKAEEIKSFIKQKKAQKQNISKSKLDLELDLALYDSILDFDKNVFSYLAKYVPSDDCADFYINTSNLYKTYLIKNEKNELQELDARDILRIYINNPSVMDKLEKRENIKQNYLNKYINTLKKDYPDYSIEKLQSLAHDNLLSHSPEIVEIIDEKYRLTSKELSAILDGYNNFKNDYLYIWNENILQKKNKLDKLNEEFNQMAKLPDEENLQTYLENKFDEIEEKNELISSATDILKSDGEIENYFSKNNLLKSFFLSPDTKNDYSEKLQSQYELLTKVISIDQDSQIIQDRLIEKETRLEGLKDLKEHLSNLQDKENIIKDIENMVLSYNSDYVLPLQKLKEEYKSYKLSNNNSLIPYQKVSFFKKLLGIFNGQNKIKAEFDKNCQLYESKICVLTQKMAMNKPDYNFHGASKLAQEIGNNIKLQMITSANTNDVEAFNIVIPKYKSDFKHEFETFKDCYKQLNIEDCNSCEEIEKYIENENTKIHKEIIKIKTDDEEQIRQKKDICDKYNMYTSMPISPISTASYLQKVSKEFDIQFSKLSLYKGDKLENLKYKAEIEQALENDSSFISKEELIGLDAAANKKAKSILLSAMNELE